MIFLQGGPEFEVTPLDTARQLLLLLPVFLAFV